MTASTRVLATLAFLGVALAPAAARAHPVDPPAVPAAIEVPDGNRAFLIAHAVGTQNYICLPRTTGTGLGWTATGPQATLFDDDLDQVLTHYLSVNPAENVARATWQSSRDSSAAWALAVASSADPAFVEAGAIPWLLLRVVGTASGLSGGDRMTRTTFIQRVATTGGSAPAGDCPAVGARTFVPYAADYVFWRSR